MRSSSLTTHSQSASRLPHHETPSKYPNPLESSSSHLTATSSHNKSARHIRTSSLAGNPAIQDLLSYQPPSLFSSHKRGTSFNQDSSRLERSSSSQRLHPNYKYLRSLISLPNPFPTSSIFSDSNEASSSLRVPSEIRNFSHISLAEIAQLKRDILSGHKSNDPLLTSYQANQNITPVPVPIITNPFNKQYETGGSKKSDNSIQTAPYFPEPKQLATEDQLPTDFEFDISQSIQEDIQNKVPLYEESPAILQKLPQKPAVPTFNLDIQAVSETSFRDLKVTEEPLEKILNKRSTHTRSLSSQPAAKREHMPEVKMVFDRKKVNDAPVPQINKVYDINEILAEVEKLEKLVSEEDAPVTNPKQKYDLPRQIPPVSQRSQRTTEPLFCDESTINYNTQSGTLATSPSKLDKRAFKIGLDNQEDNSLTDFTLKTEPKLSDRSQGGTPLALSARVQKVLKRIDDRSKIAEIAINSSRSLLSFNRSSIPSPSELPPQQQNLSNVYSFGARTPTSNQEKETGGSLSQPRSSFDVSQEMQKVREKFGKYKAVIEPQNVPEFCTNNTQSLEDTLGKRVASGVECYDASESFIRQESSNKPAYYLAAPKLIQSQKSAHLPHNNPFKKKEQAPPAPANNPDLIAHIEYNYQPPNPVILEESPEKTAVGTPKNATNASVVNVCATLDEIAFASPNRQSAPAKAADLDYVHQNIINKISYVHSDILKRISEISGKIDQPAQQNEDFVPSFNYQIPAPVISSSKPNTRQSSMDFQYDYIKQQEQVPMFPVNLLQQQQQQSSVPSTKRNNHSRNSSMGFEENNLFTMDSLQQKAREILDHVSRKSRESTPQASHRQASQRTNPASSSRRGSAKDIREDYYYPQNQSNPLQDREKLDNIKSIKYSPRMDAVLKSTATYFDQDGGENMYQRQGKYKGIAVKTNYNNKAQEFVEQREKYSKPSSPVKKGHHQRSKTSFTGGGANNNSSLNISGSAPEKNLLRQKIESKLAESRFKEQQSDYFNVGLEATPGSINQFTQSTASDLMQDLLSISNILGVKKGPKEPTRMHEKVALNNNVLKTCRKIATTGGASVGKFKENDLRPESLVNWPRKDTHVEKCLYDMVRDHQKLGNSTGKFGFRK